MKLSLHAPLVLALGLSLMACGSPEEPAPQTAAPAAAPAAPPAPVVADGPSDAVALSEEELDRLEAEKNELASRAADLESQVADGKALIAMKEKQIRELEAKLQAGKGKPVP